MADGGWLAVAGAAVGGLLTGAMAFVQNRSQQRFELRRAADERRWSETTTAQDRGHAERVRRRQELLDVYTRYQLAADRFENAVRDLAASGPASRSDLEAAQGEYDRATELMRLLAPEATAGLALQQRTAFTALAAAALRGDYDDAEARRTIADVSAPLLGSMRLDLDGPAGH